jgi:hypothetical protein
MQSYIDPNYKRNMIRAFTLLEKVLDIKPSNFNEMVFYKYIEYENVSNVAEYLNSEGYKLPGVKGQRNYTSTDVSVILDNEELHDSVDSLLKFVALGLKKRRYKTWVDKLIAVTEDYLKATPPLKKPL